MSVQAMTYVIEHSAHKGSELLVLLMIANHAGSDEWIAWPSAATLARETRMSERQVRRILDRIEASGEVTVRKRQGTTPKYLVTRGDKLTGVTSETPDIAVSATPDIAVSPEPSRTVPKPLERERDPAFDALAEAGGKNPRALTRSEARLVGVKLAEIVEAERHRVPVVRVGGPNVDLKREWREDLANTIHLAGVRYRRLHPEWELTPAAIAGHWSELVVPSPAPVQPEAEAQASGMRRDPVGEGTAITVEESERIGAEILRKANERRMAASRGQEPESDPGLAGGEEAAPPATGGSEVSADA